MASNQKNIYSQKSHTRQHTRQTKSIRASVCSCVEWKRPRKRKIKIKTKICWWDKLDCARLVQFVLPSCLDQRTSSVCISVFVTKQILDSSGNNKFQNIVNWILSTGFFLWHSHPPNTTHTHLDPPKVTVKLKSPKKRNLCYTKQLAKFWNRKIK